jgi:hypothetical protein
MKIHHHIIRLIFRENSNKTNQITAYNLEIQVQLFTKQGEDSYNVCLGMTVHLKQNDESPRLSSTFPCLVKLFKFNIRKEQ